MSNQDVTLSAQVYLRLRDDLLEGSLAPGEKLKVQDLASRYGIGASPIREALSSLVSEGFVERLDQRGFRAAKVTMDDYDELVRSRCLLESSVLRESIASGDSDWEERLLVASFRLERIEQSAAVLSSPAGEESHLAFHDALVGGCSLPTLRSVCAMLRQRANRYRNIAGVVTYPARDVSAEHSAIAKAALNRQADEAVELLTYHYHKTSAHLRTALKLALAP